MAQPVDPSGRSYFGKFGIVENCTFERLQNENATLDPCLEYV
jgi:hypothetical protein